MLASLLCWLELLGYTSNPMLQTITGSILYLRMWKVVIISLSPGWQGMFVPANQRTRTKLYGLLLLLLWYSLIPTLLNIGGMVEQPVIHQNKRRKYLQVTSRNLSHSWCSGRQGFYPCIWNILCWNWAVPVHGERDGDGERERERDMAGTVKCQNHAKNFCLLIYYNLKRIF